MTLISTFGDGQSVCLIRGDTKQVFKLFGKTMKLPDMETKIHRISDNFIAAGGGFNSIYEYVIKELISLNSNKATEIFIRLNSLAHTIPEKFATAFNIHKDIFFAVQIIGFDIEGGSMYSITYNVDDGVKISIVPSVGVGGNTIAPGDVTKAYDRLGDVNSAIRNKYDIFTLIEDLINYSMHLHYELMNDYPEEISNTFCYYVLALVNGEVMHFEGRTELQNQEIN